MSALTGRSRSSGATLARTLERSARQPSPIRIPPRISTACAATINSIAVSQRNLSASRAVFSITGIAMDA